MHNKSLESASHVFCVAPSTPNAVDLMFRRKQANIFVQRNARIKFILLLRPAKIFLKLCACFGAHRLFKDSRGLGCGGARRLAATYTIHPSPLTSNQSPFTRHAENANILTNTDFLRRTLLYVKISKKWFRAQ